MENKSIEIKKNITDLFNKVSTVFDSNGPRYFAYFGEKLVEFAGVKEGQKVLDVASGKGASLFVSAEKVGENGKVEEFPLLHFQEKAMINLVGSMS